MTVQMSSGNEKNGDPENSSEMPSSQEMTDTTHINNVQIEPAQMNSEESHGQACGISGEPEYSSHSSNVRPVVTGEAFPNGGPEIDFENAPVEDSLIEPPILFPDRLLKEIEDILPKPKWALSVIPCKEFETLLNVSIEMIKNCQYETDQLCRHFVADVIIQFYLKFYSDDLFESIKSEVMDLLIGYSFKIIEIIVMNIDKESVKLFDLLSIVFTPSKFACIDRIRPSDTSVNGQHSFTREFKQDQLVELINYFGRLGGFDSLLSCFHQSNLSIFLIYCYLKPFNNCIDYLSQQTIETYFFPILQIVPDFIENLTDVELKREMKNEGKSDNLSAIIKYLRNITPRSPNYSEVSQSLELLRLKVILRLLQVSSFNGKMNALNELNKVITCCSSDAPAPISSLNNQNEFLLTGEQMAQWLIENKVLEIVLKDCLHQPQYVEKLENIIRFLIKKNTLSPEYLDLIWNSQIEKHEIIVKNVHDLIAKMAWSFSSDQLNHLFVCFQSSWANASKKEREKLLELMRRLAEDDKDGSMAHKVLTLLWEIAYSDEDDIDIIDQAVTAHFKILDYGRTYDKDTQKIMWIKQCLTELQKADCGNSVLPAIKHIREICRTFPFSGMNTNKGSKMFSKQKNKATNRHEVLSILQDQYSFVALISNNLSAYMDQMRQRESESTVPLDPYVVCPGRRFTHEQEVQERLNFLKFVLQEGQLWLCLPQANEIWDCLARNAVCKADTQLCFRWFTSLIDQNNETDLDPETFGQFFNINILKLDHSLVDINGIECFQKYFLAVNCQQSKLILDNKYYMNNSDLVGLDYLWKLIFFCDDNAAQKAINLYIEVHINLGPNLIEYQVNMHTDLINTCFDRLKASHDTVSIIQSDPSQTNMIQSELLKMTRVLSVLFGYINKCDNDFNQERTILPMTQSFRGKQVKAFIKVLNFGRNTEDIELWTHTNESLSSIRKKILTKLKMAHNVDIEFCMGDKIDLAVCKLIGHLKFSDKLTLTARLIHSNTNISNSDFEESGSSKSNTLNNLEANLPGVIISKIPDYFSFLFKLADIGMSMNYFPLQERCLTLLKILPSDVDIVQFVKTLCKNDYASDEAYREIELDLISSPTKTIYIFGIIYSLLLPTTNPMSTESQEFQRSFITSKLAIWMLNYLVIEESFLANTDNFYKICAISILQKISKFVLSTLSFWKMFSMTSDANLNEILKLVPKDGIIQKVSLTTAQNIHNFNQIKKEDLEISNYSKLISSIIDIAFATATGSFEFLNSNAKSLHQYFLSEIKDDETLMKSAQIFDCHDVCKESIEILIILFMLSPGHLNLVINEEKSQNFFIDLLLVCNENSIRNAIMENFTVVIVKCVQNAEIVNSCISLLFRHLQTSVPKFYQKSSEFFELFCNLLNYAFHGNFHINMLCDLINCEINLLKDVRNSIVHNGAVEEIQLEGHLKITKELVMLLSPEDKFKIGSSSGSTGFISFLTDECLFTASKALYMLNNQTSDIEKIDPICSTSGTMVAAYELLVSLCTGCPENLQQVSASLETYFSNMSISDFEYYPAMGTRPLQSFVGLKNAGATCYMNSVLQQLFMIPEIRNGILSVNTRSLYCFDDNSNEDPFFGNDNSNDDSKLYNVGILKQLQIIFGHLWLGKCQYYVPKGFWRHFKLFGGPINLREQHDALEFFNSLVDSLDEALKSLGQIPIMSHIFGGTFADQKICKGCPHRYSREESFTTLNVDVRNHNSLTDSLEQYVKGDLLEGDNAYYCEKCDRKVDTVKRLCIKSLPRILAIQLKRFDYDYERESAIKFNDYFEFPRILDMQPYTVNGLAQIEGELIEDNPPENETDTRYELNGIVVHSGQASGGHYYSFILDKSGQSEKWYKFDDGDVSDWKLDNDEMRNQCFGGEYVGEVFDQMLKKMSHRSQKRWWNAFILVYRQINDKSVDEQFPATVNMPLAIKKNVQHQNIRFLHQRNLFSEEFYYFMRRLIQCNHKSLNCQTLMPKQREKIIFTTLSLSTRFLFSYGFRSKRQLRNNALEWYEDVIPYLKTNCSVRIWFLEKRFLNIPNLFTEFLLECPAPDVRMAFCKFVVLLAHYALIDKVEVPKEQATFVNPSTYANRIMSILIRLLKKEIADHSSHLAQFFLFFHMYANLGEKERNLLLSCDIPYYFILIATEEGPGYPIKYQYVDFNKLYQVVSCLVRCCNLSSKSVSSNSNHPLLPNPFKFDGHNYLMPIQDQVFETLFVKKKYLKKILKDAMALDETCNLLKFCSWENPVFSKNLLTELLCHLSNSYTYELRPFFELLYGILTLNDSWQEQRIRASFTGVDDENSADGLFDIMANHSMHLEKRAYQCIKFLVHLFNTCEAALLILKSSREFKQKWAMAVSWLNECLNYSSMSSQQFNHSNFNWTSNESTNNYALERSNSAALTLSNAEGILNKEDLASEGEMDDNIGDQGDQNCEPPSEDYDETNVETEITSNMGKMAIEGESETPVTIVATNPLSDVEEEASNVQKELPY